MKGLRVRTQLHKLIVPIARHLDDYFWALDQITLVHQSAKGTNFDEDKYRSFVLQENQSIVLTAKGFLQEFAEFISGDWDAIYGLRKSVELETFVGFQRGTVPDSVEIYFSCTDAVYWEVYALDEELLNLLKHAFINAEKCFLTEKRY